MTREGYLPKLPESPSPTEVPPEQVVWTALANHEDVYAIAYRLSLPPTDSVDSWRLATLRIAKRNAFMEAKPSHMHLRRRDWLRWRQLEESPRKMLDLLRKLVYGVRIWD